MGSFAEILAKEIGHEVTEKEKLDRSKTDRYALYKIGPVLSISVSRVYLYIQSAGFYQ